MRFDDQRSVPFPRINCVPDLLEDECRGLEAQILRLSSDVPRGGKLSIALRDLSSILSGHVENVVCTMDVVQCCKENYRMGVGTLTLD